MNYSVRRLNFPSKQKADSLPLMLTNEIFTLTTSHTELRFGGSLRSAVWTKQNIVISKTKPPCLVSSQPSQGQLVSRTYPFLFCRELFFLLPRAFWFCRELFGFAASFLVLPWAIWFCRELFGFAVSFLVLPWVFCFAVSFLFCREFLLLPRVFAFAVSFMVSPWAFWFCRGEFGFAVSILVLPWGIWYCRDTFSFAARYLLLPWQLWATVVGHRTRKTKTWKAKTRKTKTRKAKTRKTKTRKTKTVRPINCHVNLWALQQNNDRQCFFIFPSPIIYLLAGREAKHKTR